MTNQLTSIEALETFLLNNPDLERLEELLDNFNIFEAIGMVRQETRHSHLLSVLLDPHQNHGLGDRFLKRFLQRAIRLANQPLAVSAVELAVTDLSAMRVQTEWQSIDIFMRHDAEKIAVIIENKVDTGEHDDQLGRYWRTVARQFPDYRVLAFYLTPDGAEPSHEQYIAIDYGMIADLLKPFVAQGTLAPDVKMLLHHYIDMLERHIMDDTDIADLCRRIYTEHRQALDLIFEHRPDVQDELRQHFVALIDASGEWELLKTAKSYVDFRPKIWQGAPYQSNDGDLISLTINNEPNRLKLMVTVNKGELTHRQTLLDMAIANKPTGFFARTSSLNQRWNSIYSNTWLSGRDYESLSMEEMTEQITKRWQQFETSNWPPMQKMIEETLAQLEVATQPSDE